MVRAPKVHLHAGLPMGVHCASLGPQHHGGRCEHRVAGACAFSCKASEAIDGSSENARQLSTVAAAIVSSIPSRSTRGECPASSKIGLEARQIKTEHLNPETERASHRAIRPWTQAADVCKVEQRAFTGNILLTATFGVSSLEPHWTAHELLESADRALDLGKSAGRNRVRGSRSSSGGTERPSTMSHTACMAHHEELVRHFLAALAYRTQKALRAALASRDVCSTCALACRVHNT